MGTNFQFCFIVVLGLKWQRKLPNVELSLDRSGRVAMFMCVSFSVTFHIWMSKCWAVDKLNRTMRMSIIEHCYSCFVRISRNASPSWASVVQMHVFMRFFFQIFFFFICVGLCMWSCCYYYSVLFLLFLWSWNFLCFK